MLSTAITVLLIMIVYFMLWNISAFSRATPVKGPRLLLIAWLPALLLSAIPYHFVNPAYEHMNYPVSIKAYSYIFLGFLSYVFGCLSLKSSYVLGMERNYGFSFNYSKKRLLILYLIGLTVFFYAFYRSNLFGALMANDISKIFSSRLKFHVGSINHLLFFLEIGAIVFFSRYLVKGGRANLFPMMIAMLCYAVTLQKAKVLFLVLSCLFLMFLFKQRSGQLFFSSIWKKVMMVFVVIIFILIASYINEKRGVTNSQFTDFDSPLLEQVFIYSGAAAIVNFSATIEGYVQSDAPTMGRISARTFLWSFVDRETLSVTSYLEGINNGTALLFYWHDFYLLGIVIICFFIGLISTYFFIKAYTLSFLSIVFSCIVFNATFMTIYTDQFFEPQTFVMIVVTIMSWFFVKKPLMSKKTLKFILGLTRSSARENP